MLLAEYDYDTDIAVQREESFDLGLAEGFHQKALKTARLMLQRDYPSAEICLMTGLSQSEIAAIS